MAEPTIHINSVRWELEAATTRAAKEWQEEISRFSNDRMPVLINQSVQSLIPAEEIIVIPRIEVEMIALIDPSDISEAFETAWREALEEKMLVHLLSRQGVLRSETIQKSLADQLLHFLLGGNLPWYSDIILFGDRRKLFSCLLEEPIEELKKTHQAIAHSRVAGKRWINLFAEKELLLLLKKTGDLSGEAEQLFDVLQQYFHQWIPGWANHSYRKHILFSLVLEKLKSNASLTGLLTNWWQILIKEDWLTSSELAILKTGAAGLVKMESTSITERKESSATSKAEIIRHITQVLAEESLRPQFAGTEPGEEEMEEPASLVSPDEGDGHFVDNAGIILLYPCFKKWFKSLDMLNDKNEFRSAEATMKACQALQVIATGSIDIREYQLALNKVLCGHPFDKPVYGNESFLEDILEIADDKLKELIASWEKIRNTSADGFRNSFLLRKGKLTEEEDQYLLRIEKKAWDVLLDSYPWPRSIINLPWMQKPLYTEWSTH